MGYIKHHAIVLTGCSTGEKNHGDISKAIAKAKEMGLEVIGPGEQVINGYISFMICPEGSKQGWHQAEEFKKKRDAFLDWLHISESWLEWALVCYGADDAGATVLRHAWELE